ncbi:uncharacterized protein LOC101845111 [Aplysia californica]|uniref:Uncharacterized protein LOC101845111 n=1 Tax=Aplysia californica TaxID=6500 RepID=A0ABM1VW31_APLCA|nr:uncharacterized protein LOC101845111 [Aplysia californica]
MTNSCMMTPLYSRRAFAYTQIGDLTSAMRDAESVVVLDNRNPDVYCIRALVRSSRNEEKQALQDLDFALGFSPDHVACLVVRGAITRPLAEKLNPDSQSYFNVDTFSHPHILDFYDRLLVTLLVPHTITEINLNPDKPSKKQIESNVELSRLESSSPTRAGSTERLEPFRCGTPAGGDNVLAARRRHDYGEAVRKHNARPKTAADYMALLEKQRKLKAASVPRALSARQCPSQTYCDVTGSALPATTDRTVSGRRTKTASTKMFIFDIPTNYSIPVFQPVNVSEAPRMYYRPWRGDKLPVGDVPHPESALPFY